MRGRPAPVRELASAWIAACRVRLMPAEAPIWSRGTVHSHRGMGRHPSSSCLVGSAAGVGPGWASQVRQSRSLVVAAVLTGWSMVVVSPVRCYACWVVERRAWVMMAAAVAGWLLGAMGRAPGQKKVPAWM